MKTVLGITFSAALIAIAAFTCGMSAPSDAPEAGRHGRAFRHARMAVMEQRLGLTDDQKAKIKAIRGQTAVTVKALRDDQKLSREQQKAQIDPIRRSAREQMRVVLTADQQAKFAQLARHPRVWNAWAAHKMRLGAVAHRLGLTADQRARVQDVKTRAAAAIKAVRADASLTAEQKKAKVQELAQAGRQEARGVLTAEQQTKLGKMRHRMLAPLRPFN